MIGRGAKNNNNKKNKKTINYIAQRTEFALEVRVFSRPRENLKVDGGGGLSNGGQLVLDKLASRHEG